MQEKREIADELSRRTMETDDMKQRLETSLSQVETLRRQKSVPIAPTTPSISEADLKREYDRGRQDAQKSAERAIQEANDKAAAALANAASKPTITVDDLKRDYERGRSEVEIEVSQKISELEGRLEEQKSSFEKELESLKKEHSVQVENLQKQLQEAQDKAQQAPPTPSEPGVLSEEAQVQLFTNVVQEAADMLSTQPEDQTYSAKDVIRLIRSVARKLMTK
jgi:hypothetical protein